MVQVLVHGHTCVQSLHEGLVLGAAACTHALTVLDTPCKERLGTIGEDLYATEAAVEEFALQSIANSAGLRFAQLSDMGAREGVANTALEARGEHVAPLTKVERQAGGMHTVEVALS